MTTEGPQIDWRRLLTDELVDALSNDELGQYTRLMIRLLAQPDHALPTDGAVLDRWAGGAIAANVLDQFHTVDGRLRSARADAVLCDALARRRILSEAGRRGAAKVWGETRSPAPAALRGPTDRMADRPAHGHPMARPWPGHGHPTGSARAGQESGAVRASPAPTPAPAALQRSSSHSTLERSSAEEPPTPDAGRIAGAIYDGLEAVATVRLAEFRREKAVEILQRAFERWRGENRLRSRRHDGQLPDPRTEALKIAAYPCATPAACEIAVARCDQEHADPDRGPVAYAIGFVIGALGAKARGTPLTPWLSEIPIVERWQALERKVFDAAKTRAAAEAAARRIDTAIASARDRITSVPTTTTTGVASA